MVGRPEQIDRRERNPKYKRWMKRVAKRWRRRMERARLADAPKRVPFDGYTL